MSPSRWSLALCLAVLSGCGKCTVYTVVVQVEDQTSGNLLCDAKVTVFTGDAGVTIDASTAPSDAEIAASSPVCQWDTIVFGGTVEIRASAPGFVTGSATLQLPSTEECMSGSAPVTVILARS